MSTAELLPPPKHIAIIMDGNGRWARRRRMPRFAGHKAGVSAVTESVRLCTQRGVGALTLFAFSSENWSRPEEEVGLLMGLFVAALQHEIKDIHKNNVRLEVIGDCEAFSQELQGRIRDAQALTAANTGLELRIAANYGGRWDIVNAARKVAAQVEQGTLRASEVTESTFAAQLALSDLPDPDLFIRTGGDQRVSNFLLWNLAYTELYFTETLWPDFGREELDRALASFSSRQRRFGRTGDQIDALAASRGRSS
ncbi:MAG: undecaprenyl diphosphate synthase [Gammaproteobacteria bacterium]|jgi:undecaprenyl diphosphate synthase